MKKLSNDLLLKAYLNAKKSELDPKFIQQLESELKRRLIINKKAKK